MQKSNLPFPTKTVESGYRQLISDIDNHIEKLLNQRFSNTLNCRAGCDQCCIQFSVLALEAAILRHSADQMELGSDIQNGSCHFLVNKRCSVYSFRPIICRTQGLPLAYIDEEIYAIEVSACDMNFPQDYAFEENDLLFMDNFNQRLAELNRQYCQVAQRNPEERIALTDIYNGKFS